MNAAGNSLTNATTDALITGQSWMLLAVFLVVLFLAAWPLGLWLTRVADGRFPAPLSRGAQMERGLFRLAGVDATQGMGWKSTPCLCWSST